MHRVYTFERDDSARGFFSKREVSTDAVNAIVSVIGDWTNWSYVELTDPRDARPRIRVDSSDLGFPADFDDELGAALHHVGVRAVGDFLCRPGHGPNFSEDFAKGGNSGPPPFVGSIVTLRADQSEDILVRGVEEIAPGRFRGVISGFQRRPRMTYRGFDVGEAVEFCDENVCAIAGQDDGG